MNCTPFYRIMVWIDIIKDTECKGRIPLFRNYHSFYRCFVPESTWHDMVQTSLTNVFIYPTIHICYGVIYPLNGLSYLPKRLNHPPRRFTLFVTRQHTVRDICQSMALFCSHRTTEVPSKVFLQRCTLLAMQLVSVVWFISQLLLA